MVTLVHDVADLQLRGLAVAARRRGDVGVPLDGSDVTDRCRDALLLRGREIGSLAHVVLPNVRQVENDQSVPPG
jgi:hypothetical protein